MALMARGYPKTSLQGLVFAESVSIATYLGAFRAAETE